MTTKNEVGFTGLKLQHNQQNASMQSKFLFTWLFGYSMICRGCRWLDRFSKKGKAVPLQA
jgi:hypothetical protein